MKTRVQFDFDDEQVALLDEIVKRIGAASRAEVVRRALKLMDLVSKTDREGGSLLLSDKNGTNTTIVKIA